MKVFLLAGQSNMAGRAPGSEIGAPEGESAIRMDDVCSFARDVMTPYRSQGWVPLGISPAHEGIVGPHFGPEIGLGRALVEARPCDAMVFIKHGRGATNLAEDWDPDATTGKKLYRDFIEQVGSALTRLKSEGADFEIEALLWSQGEADATKREWAESYEDNLRTLFTRVRGDLGCPKLPVIIGLTGEGNANDAMTDAALVRQAQWNIAQHDSQVSVVSTDDFTLLDHVHYDAPSQLLLGRRMAEEYFRMQRSE